MADFRLGRLKFNWRGAWAASTAYVIDDIVSFKGNTYVCVVNHTSASSEGAWASTDLNIATPRWQLHVPGTRMMGTWSPNTFYAVNDLISYGANQYRCVSNHTSSASETLFYTTDVTNWAIFTESVTYKQDWTTSTWYKLNDIVKYGNTLYITTQYHTSGIAFDATKFDVYLESVNFEDTWGIGTEYQPGDIVTFGGYTYIAETINTGKQPNIYTVSDLTATPPVIADWKILTTGFTVKGDYNPATIYVPGDVVQFGGNSFVKVTTGSAGVSPTDNTAWDLVSRGLNFRGPWASGTVYNINDVVSIQSDSYVSLVNNNVGTDPLVDQQNGGTNWAALAQGESVLNLTSNGDILYRNNSGANTALPIGSVGEILTVDANSLPAWERNNTVANVFYVATDGTDDPAFGRNLSKPWRTLRYALAQTANQGSDTNIITIFVKSGTYLEQLPLVTTPYTSIVGDNLRATVIGPDPSTQSTDPTPVENRHSTMFYLSESVTLKDLVMINMEGFTPTTGSDDWDITQSNAASGVSCGVFLRLHPDDAITGKSPYITQCSAFSGRPESSDAYSSGGVGALIDKSIYSVNSNGSMLFDSFTQFHDGGVGFWCKDLGNAEIVSSFTYYCHIGYTCTGGGRIRSLAGNNSYGTYGAVSSGSDATETLLEGEVRGNRLDFDYLENSVKFKKREQVVQGTPGVVQTITFTGTTLVGQANDDYGTLTPTSTTGTGLTVDVSRDAAGELTVTLNAGGEGYAQGDTALILGSLVGGVDGTDDIVISVSSVASDFSVTNPYYALALVLYTQESTVDENSGETAGDDYLLIEAITGTFLNGKPIEGVSSSETTGSGALGTTDATAALGGITGKIFTVTGLPVDETDPNSPEAVLPKRTGAVKFKNVVGNTAYNDDGYYVIQDVTDASTAQNLSLTTLRRYDVPGTAPTGVEIATFTSAQQGTDENLVTFTCNANHGLSDGDEVVVAISNPTYSTYSTPAFVRLPVTVINGTQFSYVLGGGHLTAYSNPIGLAGSKVYLQTTTGGSTKALHSGGSNVTLFNVSSVVGRLEVQGIADLSDSETLVALSDPNVAAGFGAGDYVILNNEMMEIQSVDTSLGVTVTRNSAGDPLGEPTTHAEGTIVYFATKTEIATTLRVDIDTALNDLQVFSVTNFDVNDIVRIDNELFRITSVNTTNVGNATVTFSRPKDIAAASGQEFDIRLNYSQVRLTGHDFLLVGTGGKAATGWPNVDTANASQDNEVYEDFPGRVYYVSTDQDGNFRVGTFFLVEQATGKASLDANSFDLSGLSSLRLGSIGAQLGAAINEFSTATDLGGDQSRDSACPTQLAVKTYVDNQTGGGVVRETPTISLSTLTSSGTTATFTSFGITNLNNGDSVIIAGADQGNYNGEFVVFNVSLDGKSFQYTMPGTATAATGPITCTRLQRVQTGIEFEGNLQVNPTWDTATKVFTGVDISITDTNSQGSSKILDAKVGGTSKFTVDKNGNISAAGNLTVAGTTTTVSSQNLVISDKEIIIGNGAGDSAAASGAGLKIGSTAYGFTYEHNADAALRKWNLPSAGLNIGGSLQISGTNVLSSDTLGTGIVNSSLTTVGTLSGLAVSGRSIISSVSEGFNVVDAANGNLALDLDNGSIYYLTNVAGDVNPALSNVPTTANQAHSVVVAIQQTSTIRKIGNSVGVNGTSVTVKWPANIQPTGKASNGNIDVWSFTILNTGSEATPNWIVLGSATEAFGG